MELDDFSTPFLEASKHHGAKEIMATSMSSADLRTLDAGIRRMSLHSARTLMTDYLDKIFGAVSSIVEPQTVQRPDRITPENPEGNVTVGMNPATAKASMLKWLRDNNYVPEAGEEGTIKDLSSEQRLNLVVDTNVKLAQGAGMFVQSNTEGVVELYPAWELVRYGQRAVPRGEKVGPKGVIEPDPENSWPERFRAAATASGDTDAARVLDATGRMMARKDSPLWESLGTGAGGYEDTLDNPYPPFAFNSGMWTEDVSRQEAIDAGLIDEGDVVKPADFDFASLFGEAA
jgi:hypothetical protein